MNVTFALQNYYKISYWLLMRRSEFLWAGCFVVARAFHVDGINIRKFVVMVLKCREERGHEW